MKLKFYGTRGSIPICDAGFQQFGGNTTCLQITFTDTNRVAIIDAGTGLRNLGRDLRAIGFRGMLSIELFNATYWSQDALTVLQTALGKLRGVVKRSLATTTGE